MNLKEIIQIIEDKGFTAYEIHRKTGLNQAGLRNILNGKVEKPQRKTFEILKNFVNAIESNIIDKKETYEKEKRVPYYDIDVTSHITTSFSDVVEKPTFYVDYQPFNDCSAYVNNYGDSMYPKYKNGEKLAVKQILNLDVLMFGETYLIITNANANDLKTVKEVHYHKDQSKLILRAANPDYQGDTIIDKVDILSMFAVKGKISQNFI